MSNPRQTVVILGAGPAGLAAAHAAQDAGHRVVIVEKSDIAGGKGGSRTWKDFVVDFGPHAFHAITPRITNLVLEYGGGDMIDLPIVQRLYVTGRPMGYPLNLAEAIGQFGLWLNLRIMRDFLFVRIKSWFVTLPRESFEQYGIATFGRTLYDLCFGWYSERVWGCSPDTLSVEFARRKLPNASLGRLVLQALMHRGKENAGSYLSVRRYLYHRHGIGNVFQNIADGVTTRGGEVIYNASIAEVELSSDGRATHVRLDAPHPRRIAADWVVSTLPFDDLLGYLSRPIESLRGIGVHLPFRHGLIINAVVNREKLDDAHWMYLVNKRFHFNRVSEPKNFSPLCGPANQTLLMLEKMCAPGDPMWRWQPEQWRPMVEADLGFFGVAPREIGEIFVTRMEKAFPFFRVGYEAKRQLMLTELAGLQNVVTTGRYGLYLDTDMHDAMVLGEEGLAHLTAGKLAEFYRRHQEIVLERRTVPAGA